MCTVHTDSVRRRTWHVCCLLRVGRTRCCRLLHVVHGCRLTTADDARPLCRPEALGLVSGVVFIAFIIVGQLVFASAPEALVKYNAALLCVRSVEPHAHGAMHAQCRRGSAARAPTTD